MIASFFKFGTYSWRTRVTTQSVFKGENGDQMLILNNIYSLKTSFWKTKFYILYNIYVEPKYIHIHHKNKSNIHYV